MRVAFGGNLLPDLFCPVCKTTYQDQTLVFCLNDGTKLVSLGNNSETTVQMSHQMNPVRVNIPNSEPTIQAQSTARTPQTKNRKSSGFLIGFLIAGFLGVIAAAGAIGAYFLFAGKSNDTATTTPIPTPAITPVQTNTAANSNAVDKADALTKELEEKLKRLEKQLEDQKNPGKSPESSQNQSSYATAKVNSPNDGFLALRSLPNTETGSQIMKIPHGSTVVLNNCEKNTVKISGRNGRWCNVEYADRNGWVFSAWLDY